MACPESYAKSDRETKLESRFSGCPGHVLSIPLCWAMGHRLLLKENGAGGFLRCPLSFLPPWSEWGGPCEVGCLSWGLTLPAELEGDWGRLGAVLQGH